MLKHFSSQFSPPSLSSHNSPLCPSLSPDATHSGVFFVPLSLVSQEYAFVPLSCLVQKCYLCGGLICFITSFTSPGPPFHCFLTKVSTLVPSLKNWLLICVAGMHFIPQHHGTRNVTFYPNHVSSVIAENSISVLT